MASYSQAIRAFAARNSGPVGDTKYDIFDQSGMTRAQMRRARTTRPRRVKPARRYKPASTGFVPGETI
jgi:hypothetical protein